MLLYTHELNAQREAQGLDTVNSLWLSGCGVALDTKGFVLTGSDDHKQRPLPLESNLLGVFAVGDVRSGSVKRIGGAIGEGAAVVSQLHVALADPATTAR